MAPFHFLMFLLNVLLAKLNDQLFPFLSLESMHTSF